MSATTEDRSQAPIELRVHGLDCAEERLAFDVLRGKMTVRSGGAPVPTEGVRRAPALAGLATLWLAIAADMGASLLVIAYGLRLLRG